LIAGVSVAFVLLPQAIAYARVAGLPAESGVWVAAVAPIAAAFAASSPYLGTGPTGITSLLTFGALAAIAVPGSSDFVGLAAILALLVGVVRIVIGLLRAGVVAYLMSQPVLTGFTTAAGLVIIASQVPTVLGVNVEETQPFIGAARAIGQLAEWHLEGVAIAAIVGLGIPLGRRIHALFPSVFFLVVAAVAYSYLTDYSGPIVGNVDTGLPVLGLSVPWTSTWRLLLPALVISVVGFSEAASIARTYATLERKRWDPDREFIGQGLANLAAGAVGGFPSGGSFTRSGLTRAAGAHTRLSGAISGLVVLLLIPFMGLVSHLPIAVLGALVIAGVANLVRFEPFGLFKRAARLQFIVAMITFLLTLVLAPHVEYALVIGVTFAVGAHLWRELRLAIPTWTEGGTLHIAPRGVLYFASAPSVEEAFSTLLAQHPESERLLIHLEGLGRVDLTGALVLQRVLQDAGEAGLDAKVVDVPPQARKIIRRVLGESLVDAVEETNPDGDCTGVNRTVDQ
jgi:SulP family sulfate permease